MKIKNSLFIVLLCLLFILLIQMACTVHFTLSQRTAFVESAASSLNGIARNSEQAFSGSPDTLNESLVGTSVYLQILDDNFRSAANYGLRWNILWWEYNYLSGCSLGFDNTLLRARDQVLAMAEKAELDDMDREYLIKLHQAAEQLREVLCDTGGKVQPNILLHQKCFTQACNNFTDQL